MIGSLQISYFSLAIRILLAALIVGLGFVVSDHWSSIVAAIVEWQKTLHTMLAGHIRSVSEAPFAYGGALIALSFAYGVFHAVGPGHGKAVIVTYLGSHKESIWRGVSISFSAATLQSLVAIVLVSALAQVLKFKLADVHNVGNDVALVSYVLVGLLGLMLLIKAWRRYWRLKDPGMNLVDAEAKQHQHHGHFNDQHAHDHPHDEACGCSHAYVAEQNKSLFQTLMVILSMGFRPCSGAIVVLIYAHLVDVYFFGVIATLLMGIGTGLSVSLIAIATLYARSWLERSVLQTEKLDSHLSLRVTMFIQIMGGSILIILGWSLFNAASALSSGHPLF